MPVHQLLDDNGKPFAAVCPSSTAGIVVATTGAAVVEASVATIKALAVNANGDWLARIAVVGTNAALVAFDAAGAAASHTGNTNMTLIPANTVEIWRLRSTDVSLYHLQVTGASTVQVTALV